jgi:hypothetical protein
MAFSLQVGIEIRAIVSAALADLEDFVSEPGQPEEQNDRYEDEKELCVHVDSFI